MAKLERNIVGNIDEIVDRITRGILDGSVTASLEEGSDFQSGDCRCSVRAFERYSHMGQNRVSLHVTLLQQGDGPVHLVAMATGGSQAMFFKLNTWGEEAFLDKLVELL